jgi:hypothetical protein
MAKLVPGTFGEYELTRQEQLSGAVLSTEQKIVLQNELSQIANNRVNLDFDPTNPTKFAQDEAFLKGQMSIIRVMLLRSDESEVALQKLASDSQTN